MGTVFPFTRVRSILALLGLLAIGAVLSTGISSLKDRLHFRDDLPAVVEQIKSLSRLEGCSVRFQKIEDASSTPSPLPSWLIGDRVLLVADGEAVAGVDLSKMTRSDIQVNGDSVTVRMPPPQIFSVRLDDRSYVYDHQPGLLSKVDPALETEARNRATQSIRDAALAQGILQKARAATDETVRGLFTAAQFHHVTMVE